MKEIVIFHGTNFAVWTKKPRNQRNIP